MGEEASDRNCKELCQLCKRAGSWNPGVLICYTGQRLLQVPVWIRTYSSHLFLSMHCGYLLSSFIWKKVSVGKRRVTLFLSSFHSGYAYSPLCTEVTGTILSFAFPENTIPVVPLVSDSESDLFNSIGHQNKRCEKRPVTKYTCHTDPFRKSDLLFFVFVFQICWGEVRICTITSNFFFFLIPI